MLQAARSSNELMSSIARDSQEQASAIEEVNASVRQMDEMTQHNAALVEETNAAIEQTEAQAKELDQIVEIFVVDGARPVARSEAPPRPKALPRPVAPKARAAAKSYLAPEAVAVGQDWSEF